jgi:hypothetical protein
MKWAEKIILCDLEKKRSSVLTRIQRLDIQTLHGNPGTPKMFVSHETNVSGKTFLQKRNMRNKIMLRDGIDHV